MNTLAKRFSETVFSTVEEWARRRQGIDPRSARLESRRIYILPTRAGVIYAIAVFTMLLGAMNYNNNMGFALTFLLVGIAIISIYHCHRNLTDVHLHFTGSQPTFAGESIRFSFAIENQSAFSREQLRFGRDGRQKYCDALAPGTRQKIDVRLDTVRRGRLALPRLLLSTRYPLGLFRAWAWINMDITEIVYPQPAPRAPMSMTNHNSAATVGPKSPGDDDLSGFRAYRAGDPPKRIAWKILARSGETLVTEYHGGAHDPVWIDWHDCTASQLEDRLALLTRRILDADAAGHVWGLRTPDQVVDPGRGATHRHRCLRVLALFDAGADRGHA